MGSVSLIVQIDEGTQEDLILILSRMRSLAQVVQMPVQGELRGIVLQVCPSDTLDDLAVKATQFDVLSQRQGSTPEESPGRNFDSYRGGYEVGRKRGMRDCYDALSQLIRRGPLAEGEKMRNKGLDEACAVLWGMLEE